MSLSSTENRPASKMSAPLTHAHKHDGRPILYTQNGEEVTYTHIMHIPSSELCRPGSRYSVTTNFFAGAFALSTAFAVMHPLDTLKTKMQAVSSSTLTYKALFNAQLFRQLMSGILTSVAGAAPQGGIRISTYEFTKVELDRRNIITNNHPLLLSAVSATCGDIASSFVKVPREVLTQRLQTGQFSSVWACASDILQREGLKGFYRGYISTQLRDVPFMVLLFSCYENAKALTGNLCEESSVFAALFGAVSGATAGFCTTPFDVLKTKIITQREGMSLSETYKRVVSEKSHRALLTGAIPRSVWWFCVCGLFFPIYETTKASIHKGHEQSENPSLIGTVKRVFT